MIYEGHLFKKIMCILGCVKSPPFKFLCGMERYDTLFIFDIENKKECPSCLSKLQALISHSCTRE